MTRSFSPWVSALLILAAGCGFGKKATVGGTALDELVSARTSLKQAMLDRDIEAIEQIYTEGYGLVTRTGALQTRAERIEMIESGKLRYLKVGEESEVSINTYGNVAVIRGVVGSSETVFEGERRITPARRFTEIWVYENEKWKEAGRQSTAITTTDASNLFVGTWSLERIEERGESGEWTPLQDRFGVDPVGYIMYDSVGHMSVQIMRKDRSFFSVEDRRSISPTEAKDALLGYTAYFGTFSVDPEEQSVTHHRIGHIVPNQATVEGKRFYQFSGNQLTLTLPGRDVRLIWTRL